PDDQSDLAKRFRGGFVCASPSPRGIRSLGCRKKGRSFHFFLDAHYGRVYPLCRASAIYKLPGCFYISYFGPDGKTNAGNPASCPASSGLLASAALRTKNIRSGNPRGDK